jgi:hypothetical protein
MSTPYSDIFELFLAGMQDYKIDRLYQSATPSLAEDYMKPFLIRGLVNFEKCTKDLSDRNDTTMIFNIVLNDKEKVILSNLMIVEWLRKEVNDILQMKLFLNDTDFKIHSAANNLKEKREHLNSLREEVDKQMTSYSYGNINWTTYQGGTST